MLAQKFALELFEDDALAVASRLQLPSWRSFLDRGSAASPSRAFRAKSANAPGSPSGMQRP